VLELGGGGIDITADLDDSDVVVQTRFSTDTEYLPWLTPEHLNHTQKLDTQYTSVMSKSQQEIAKY
jgi:hypothetical protein